MCLLVTLLSGLLVCAGLCSEVVYQLAVTSPFFFAFQVTNKSLGPDSPSDTVGKQTDFDVTIRQRVVSSSNLARAIPVRRKALSDSEVKVCLLP